jgi:hypothetical protein
MYHRLSHCTLQVGNTGMMSVVYYSIADNIDIKYDLSVFKESKQNLKIFVLELSKSFCQRVSCMCNKIYEFKRKFNR